MPLLQFSPLLWRSLFLLAAAWLLAFPAGAQNLFPEKYAGCQTSEFSLESDSVEARTDYRALAAAVTSALKDDAKNRLRGELVLQIIVEPGGSGCLISVQNNTNVKSGKLRLKESVDGLKWQGGRRRVAAVVSLSFADGQLDVKRLGMNANKGVHALRE
jgi:hypothetical protein